MKTTKKKASKRVKTYRELVAERNRELKAAGKAAGLPKGIKDVDLTLPKFNDYYVWDATPDRSGSFDLIKTSSGWCIATLHIRKPRRGSASVGGDRVYAIDVTTKEIVTVGMGPHVLARFKIYVRKSRREALQKFLDLLLEGTKEANEIRDSISTARAQTTLYRRKFRY